MMIDLFIFSYFFFWKQMQKIVSLISFIYLNGIM